MMFKILPIVILMVFSISACQKKSELATTEIEVTPAGLEKIVNTTLDQVVLINIDQWQAATEHFSLQTKQFCLSPKKAELSTLQNSFKEMALAWNQALMYDFGPLRDNLFFPKIHFIESMRQRGKDYSASIQTHINQRLSDKTPLNSNYFDQLKFTLVGMTAIEQLIFTDKKVFKNHRQCELLIGMADLNLRNANYVVSGWKNVNEDVSNYRDIFLQNRFPDGEKSLTKLIFSLQDYLRYVRQRKINGKLDYSLSKMSYENMATGLRAVANTLNANRSGYGLTDYMIKAGNEQVVIEFENKINKTLKAINQQDIKALNTHYLELIKMFEKEIPQALGVNLGMNFVDGD